MKKYKKIFGHLAAWILFITYEISAVFVITRHTSSWGDYSGHYLLNIALFYSTVYLVLPMVAAAGKYKYLVMMPALLAEAFLYMGVNYSLNRALQAMAVAIVWKTNNLEVFVGASLWRAFYIIGLACGYWFAVQLYRSMKSNIALTYRQMESNTRQLILEKEAIRAENAFLQAQINPHLLFNTLNFVYNEVEGISVQAGEAILLLSAITRYALQCPDAHGFVSLGDEVNNLHHIIKLNKIRFGSRLRLEVEFSGNFEGLKITPLILISFVENIFKHAELRDTANPAMIRLLVSENQLHLVIRNRKTARMASGNGIGVTNTMARLAKNYPDRHTLTITNTDRYYELILLLSLDHVDMLCY